MKGVLRVAAGEAGREVLYAMGFYPIDSQVLLRVSLRSHSHLITLASVVGTDWIHQRVMRLEAWWDAEVTTSIETGKLEKAWNEAFTFYLISCSDCAPWEALNSTLMSLWFSFLICQITCHTGLLCRLNKTKQCMWSTRHIESTWWWVKLFP